jgi:hypothetical protein
VAPPRGAARRDAPAPRREPLRPATTPTPTGAGTASTATASASSSAVREQGDDDVLDEEFPHDFAPELSHRPLGYGDGHSNPNMYPTQESVVSETQPNYLSTPAAARLLSSITSQHPAGPFYFPAPFHSPHLTLGDLDSTLDFSVFPQSLVSTAVASFGFNLGFRVFLALSEPQLRCCVLAEAHFDSLLFMCTTSTEVRDLG